MKWNKYTIETTTAAEDYLSSALMDLGIEGVQIEDNVPLTKEDRKSTRLNSSHMPKSRMPSSA